MEDKQVLLTEESLDTLIDETKKYADNAASQKTQIQLITWEETD